MEIDLSSSGLNKLVLVPLLLIVCATLSPVTRAALIVEVENFSEHSAITGTPSISVGPVGTDKGLTTDIGSELGSKAIYGNTNAAHAVTAARAAHDFAVNAKIDAKDDFPQPSLNFTRVTSNATRSNLIRNLSDGVPLTGTIPVRMTFHIPPSEIEITVTNELPDLTMYAGIDASIFDIQIDNNQQNVAVSLFSFQAFVTGSFRSGPSLSHNNLLGSPLITITNQSGGAGCGQFDAACTFRYQFPEYFGFLDVGQLAPHDAKLIDYVLTASVSGPAAFTGAIAAINDPFFFSTDPVTPFQGLQFAELAPVPLPPALVLFGSALALLRVARRHAARQ